MAVSSSFMARPKQPLITRREVYTAALRIIDEEGLDALSTRRLAAALGVSSPALYHHFAGKDEIIAGAIGVALEDVRLPSGAVGDWREWLLRNAQRFRDGLAAHPNLTPAIVDGRLPRVGLSRLDEAVRLLDARGIPGHATVAIVEILEAFAVGSILIERSGGFPPPLTPEQLERYTGLAEALRDPTPTVGEQFDVGCRALIDALAAGFCTPADRTD